MILPGEIWSGREREQTQVAVLVLNIKNNLVFYNYINKETLKLRFKVSDFENINSFTSYFKYDEMLTKEYTIAYIIK